MARVLLRGAKDPFRSSFKRVGFVAKKLTIAALMLGGASGLSPALAQTALTTTQSTTAAQFSTTQVQSRNGAGTSTFAGTTSTTGPTLVPISRFDTNTGILVGARFTVNIPYSISVSATGTVPAAGTGRTVDVTSTVTGSVTIGGTSISTGAFAASPKCNSGDCLNQSTNNTATSTGTLTGTTAVTGANLASLAGTGAGTVNFSTQVNATNTQIINGSAVTTGFATSNFVVGSTTTASNQYSVSYDYLNFSRPSFTTPNQTTAASVNFGTVFRNSGTVTQAFAISNLTNTANGGVAANTSATSLTGVSRATNDSTLSTSLTALSNLGGGNTSGSFNIAFNPNSVGAKSDTFTFTMTDTPLVGGVAAVGAVGMRSTNLTYSVTANVINHASPSFNGSTIETSKTLDFGSVSSRGGPVLLNFSLFNIGDANSAGLELYQINGPGNSMFTSNVSTFLNLAGGASNNYSVTLNPLNLGVANGIYTFLFRDYAPGVSGGQNYSLTLNLLGSVYDPVPEPANWAMMLMGFGFVGAMARRRRGAISA